MKLASRKAKKQTPKPIIDGYVVSYIDKKSTKYHRITLTAFAGLFGLIGASLLFTSGAAVRPFMSFEPESIVKSGNVSTVNDATASGGSTLRFEAPPVAVTPPPVTYPSGVAPPTTDIPGWKLILSDDFTTNSTTVEGMNWKSLSDGGKVVYTGANLVGGSTKWTTYPETYLDTYQKRPYRSGDVLSTHNGVLDFYLHTVSGQPAGANPSPIISGTSHYQLYGRYSARIKTDTTNLQGYYVAWLLWPESDASYKCAESDYPEGSLSSTSGTVSGFHHYGCSGSQDAFSGSAKFTDWHTYTQEWGPGFRKYYIDNTLIKTTTNQVWAQPQRWQLQTETNGTGTFGSGHLLVDWVAVYSYKP